MGFSDAVNFLAGLALCIFIRIYAVVPNVEPIMGFTMPYTKKYGKAIGAIFPLISIISIDFLTHNVGLWTIYTALAYAAVGFFAGIFFSKRNASRKNFVLFAILGTLAYDITTALLFGWQFAQPLEATLLGQIPFTLNHLLGNIAYALIVSPLILLVLNKSPLPKPNTTFAAEKHG